MRRIMRPIACPGADTHANCEPGDVRMRRSRVSAPIFRLHALKTVY